MASVLFLSAILYAQIFCGCVATNIDLFICWKLRELMHFCIGISSN